MEGPQRGFVGDHLGQTNCLLIEYPHAAFGEPLVWVQCLPDRPNAINVTVFFERDKISAERKKM